jgi:tetratricopeptide (TPR) repeat protein
VNNALEKRWQAVKSVYVLLSIAGILSPSLWGQASVRQQLQQAFSFQEQGRYDKVIEVLPALLQSDSLAPLEKGQTWTVLAFAYEQQGDVHRAEDSYEQALRTLQGDEQFTKDYAIALENFANLYREMGRLNDGFRLDMRALQMFQGMESHDGIARTCASLASIELTRKRLRQSEQYLRIATSQAELADGLDEDYYADVSMTRARRADLRGNFDAAIAEYQHSLDLWRGKHGEEHMITGWGYLLLGRAYARARSPQEALDKIRRGLDILNHSVGPHSPKYLQGEILYSQVLETTGARNESMSIRIAAKTELTALYRTQCVDCRVNVAALR